MIRKSATMALALIGITWASTMSAQAGVIAVAGGRAATLATFLTSNGHMVVNFGISPSASAASYVGVDAIVLDRVAGNTAVANFILGGGTLVTEWTAADWALNTANLLDADISGGGFVGHNLPITFTAAGIAAGLNVGVSNPFSDGGSTEYFRNIVNIGSSVQILGTRPTNIAAIIGGASGLGNSVILAYDWLDDFGANSRQVLLNALNLDFQVGVPVPSAIGLFGLGLMLIGGVSRRRQAA